MTILFLYLMMSSTLAKEPNINVSMTKFIKTTERKFGLPKGILSAVIKVESNGQVNALNPNDGTRKQRKAGLKIKSHGLMQIQLATARHIGFKGTAKELTLPHTNVHYGAAYLKHLLKLKDNNLSAALVCYNSGENSFVCKNKVYTKYLGKILNAWRVNK